jgi:hypothetical protein
MAQPLFQQVVTVAQDAQHQSREPLPRLLVAVAVAAATAVAQAILLLQAAQAAQAVAEMVVHQHGMEQHVGPEQAITELPTLVVVVVAVVTAQALLSLAVQTVVAERAAQALLLCDMQSPVLQHRFLLLGQIVELHLLTTSQQPAL